MTMMEPIFLDHGATTPLDPQVLEAMFPYLGSRFGNPASRDGTRGLEAETAIDDARQAVADLVGARPPEILFTGGATESNNLALQGVAAAWGFTGHLIIGPTEHPSVFETARFLESRGLKLTVLTVGSEGRVDPQDLAPLLAGDRVLVSLMHANNETGAIHPIAEIAALCRASGALLHCDASQSAGKIPIDVQTMGVDLLSLSAHKFYGPKGVGALWVRRKAAPGKPRVRLQPLVFGGGQERGLRSGTQNVAGIVGLGAAAATAGAGMAESARKQRFLTQLMLDCLQERLGGVTPNGSLRWRLPGTLNLSFEGLSAEQLQLAIKPVVEVSTGSACSTGKAGPSPGLLALGLSPEQADSAVRFVVGRFTTEGEVHRAMDALVSAAERLRALALAS